MLIGSNNSLTYLEPSSWWLKLFGWIGRHQERPYDIQYTYYGARLFDIRLHVDNKSRLVARNGAYEYPLNCLYEMLDYFDKREDVTVLITLDTAAIECNDSIMNKFKNTCHSLDSIYEHVRFCGGYRRFDRMVIYKFDWEAKNGMPRTICPSEWSELYKMVRLFFPFWIRKSEQNVHK